MTVENARACQLLIWSERRGVERVGSGMDATFHGVRYQVTDVQRAIDFYTRHLGFTLEQQALPAFATVALDSLRIYLSGPGASGSRPLPGGEAQHAGGSNRVVLQVTDLPAVIEAMRGAGVPFRNAMETGPGGKQIQVLDPDGNPVELFEPAGAASR